MISRFVLYRAAAFQLFPFDGPAAGWRQSLFNHAPIQLNRGKLSVVVPVVAVAKRALFQMEKDYVEPSSSTCKFKNVNWDLKTLRIFLSLEIIVKTQQLQNLIIND